MSRTTHDSPYRDDPSPRTAPPRNSSSRPARKSNRPRQQDHPRKPQASNAAHSGNGSRASHSSRGSHPTHPPHPPHPPREAREARAAEKRHPAPVASRSSAVATAAPPARRRSRRGRRGNGSGAPSLQLTSHPTGRAAYADTRAWLLKEHGPICAYCAREFTPQVMTLDHVAPRRGQTAYDRRDNLVLACRGCNEAKRDISPLAYLLAVRSRAANLLRYGSHLSPGLLDLARSLMPKGHDAPGAATSNGARPERVTFGSADDDGDSPYRD